MDNDKIQEILKMLTTIYYKDIWNEIDEDFEK